VQQALAVDYSGSTNGQVRDVPDVRTIRYYTSLGLLDRPAGFRGRKGLYGRRHLVQLVAIKRLQAQGLSLRSVQEQLVGLPMSKLEALARVPAQLEPSPRKGPAEGPRPAFWKEVPALPQDFSPAEEASPKTPPLFQGIPLGEGVSLLVPLSEPFTSQELEALRAAAMPLLQFLHARRSPPSP
jgi:DNA-binding transcriptional MerR regulator